MGDLKINGHKVSKADWDEFLKVAKEIRGEAAKVYFADGVITHDEIIAILDANKDNKITYMDFRRFTSSLFGRLETELKKHGFKLFVKVGDGLDTSEVNSFLWSRREFVLDTVKKYSWALQFADESLRNDKEVVLAAVRQGGRALYFASITHDGAKSSLDALFLV